MGSVTIWAMLSFQRPLLGRRWRAHIEIVKKEGFQNFQLMLTECIFWRAGWACMPCMHGRALTVSGGRGGDHAPGQRQGAQPELDRIAPPGLREQDGSGHSIGRMVLMGPQHVGRCGRFAGTTTQVNLAMVGQDQCAARGDIARQELGR